MLGRGAAAVIGVLLFLLGLPIPAFADSPVSCPPGTAWDNLMSECVIVVTDPGEPGDSGGPSDPTDGDTGVGQPPQSCMWADTKVPCRGQGGYWSNERGCYIGLDPAFKAGNMSHNDPIWGGHYPDGAIYLCYNPWLGGGNRGYSFWAATPPAGPVAPPDPRELAQQAIALMQLQAIDIGIVPEDQPGRIGVIGLPTWMWAENPGEQTIGPITRTASAGGYSVTATATVSKVVWDMGDGSSVICTGPGTPYADSYGKQESPDCGYTYTRDGRYAVTATSHWTVEWSGIGQSGTIPLELSHSTNITMGEVQVIVQ